MKVPSAVRLYVAQKREMGWHFRSVEKLLLSFSSCVGDIHLSDVTRRQISSFLAGPRTSNSTWHQKYVKLSRFFEYWRFRGQVTHLPMPPAIPHEPNTFVPFIYSRQEINRLLSEATAERTKYRRLIDPATFRALFLFLYGTGVAVGEALALRQVDLDFDTNVMVLRGDNGKRMRVIPFGPDVHIVLKAYLDSPIRRQFDDGQFFLTRKGKPIKPVTLISYFQELRARAGVVRLDGACYQPRMHDLRSTFAVHRIAAWYQQQRDVERMLPALGAYLGQSGLTSLYRHLALTPEHFLH